ncbi:hypothetical protein HNY73_013984 [Argiope bruennichi]|uniref:Uncharacterized protein n=1 Tax=Argiope bruennichi TaxID=94029 RepID=A0A8T0ESS7_ARGBR|nr:hypothetical protein HNY73_013984 [Argiope bruennichi]
MILETFTDSVRELTIRRAINEMVDSREMMNGELDDLVKSIDSVRSDNKRAINENKCPIQKRNDEMEELDDLKHQLTVCRRVTIRRAINEKCRSRND